MVNKIMHVQNISAGEDSGHRSLKGIGNNRPGGGGAHGHAGTFAQLVLRNQADGQEKRITVELHLCAGNRATVFIHFGNGYAFKPFSSLNIGHRMGKIERDIIIIQTLNNIAVEAGGERHDFHAGENLCSLQGHTPCHDEADVAGTQDHHPFSGHHAFQVNKALGCSG